MKLGVLISGRGSNLAAVLDAEKSGALPTETRVVISNVANAKGLETAKNAGVATVTLAHETFASRSLFDEAIVKTLREYDVEWVLLAGFMRLVTPALLRAFENRVINIHPSLLPSFPGTHAQRQAIEYGVRQTGVTVHLVDEGTDTGPVLAQSALAVLDGDTEASLSSRLLAVEHGLLVTTLASIATRGFSIDETAPRKRVVWNF